MKKLLQEYFSFSRKERTGIQVLLTLILVTSLIVFYLPLSTVPVEADARLKLRQQLALLEQQQDSVRTSWGKNSAYADGVAKEGVHRLYDEEPGAFAAGELASGVALFAFDPNTLSAAGWRKLGVQEKTITTIQHYLAKGGKFRQPADLCRIYGLPTDLCERLLPYVTLPVTPSHRQWPAWKDSSNNRRTWDSSNYRRWQADRASKSVPLDIEVNTADTAAWIALRGIGSKLAARIVRFRDKLGGFYHVDQVGETFGLPDSTFRQIRGLLRCNAALVRTVNINTAGADSLKLHPYISWQIANAIVQYRQQHGVFRSVDQLLHINIITPEILAKAGPYLTTGEGR